MKLTKELETEILQYHYANWEANLNGDMEAFASYLDKDFSIFGSANGEVFLGREEALAFYTATADQMKGKAQLRNRNISIQPIDDDIVVVRELCDLYVLIGNEWTFYGHCRLSCLSKRTAEGWKLVHQHVSLPDHRTEEGEQIASEKIEKENLELREAVKRRTTELEHKNRELAIEAALERVRARTMAMQHSHELAEASLILVQQLEALGMKTWGCAFNITDEDSSREWFSNAEGSLPMYTTPRVGIFKRYYDIGLQGETLHVEEISGKACEDHYEFLCTLPIVGEALINIKEAGGSFPSSQIDHVAYFKYGYLLFITFEPVPEAYDVFKRFAKAFEQTYTRFLDLQTVEAQSKESQIQLALERVRARTMAMQQSSELADAAAVLFQQVRNLGIETYTSGFNIWDETEDKLISWMSNPSGVINPPFIMPAGEYGQHKKFFEGWKNDLQFMEDDLTGEKTVAHYKYLRSFPLLDQAFATAEKAGIKTPERQVHNVVFFSHGYLLFVSLEPQPESHELFKRFGKVFQQTYTRFLDLKKAEEQAKEAQIEVALEKVRSRTLAMQKSSELSEAAAVLFSQLIGLNISPDRLYLGIIQDEPGQMEFWITDEKGSKVTRQFTGDAGRNPSMKKMYDAWHSGAVSMTIDMEGKELEDYFHYLTNELKVSFKDGLTKKRRIQSVAFFGKGFVGMASPDPQPEETPHLLERFAAVFTLTYTRFNDLKLAEAHAMQAKEDLIKLQTEKKRAEEALKELKATQVQLIQSEKMASLGELTAGIAHEIQNPLNFVNNFSEVSMELIEELADERNKQNGKRDAALEEELLSDISENLKKINHHGRRASGIVKGMLEHSRASTGIKEAVDINLLVEEYLKLTYHGLRANDKSFNVTLRTDFDPTAGKINMVPQDLGRVIMNLLTNAFYAVKERKSMEEDRKFEPTVSVSTQKLSDRLEIRVSDNGKGIAKAVADKIYQPFFTTKPTGKGTGLGLSMSYDIVTKGHGGELKMVTVTAEEDPDRSGTSFMIFLPY